jgi:hypothetical protein
VFYRYRHPLLRFYQRFLSGRAQGD